MSPAWADPDPGVSVEGRLPVGLPVAGPYHDVDQLRAYDLHVNIATTGRADESPRLLREVYGDWAGLRGVDLDKSTPERLTATDGGVAAAERGPRQALVTPALDLRPDGRRRGPSKPLRLGGCAAARRSSGTRDLGRQTATNINFTNVFYNLLPFCRFRSCGAPTPMPSPSLPHVGRKTRAAGMVGLAPPGLHAMRDRFRKLPSTAYFRSRSGGEGSGPRSASPCLQSDGGRDCPRALA